MFLIYIVASNAQSTSDPCALLPSSVCQYANFSTSSSVAAYGSPDQEFGLSTALQGAWSVNTTSGVLSETSRSGTVQSNACVDDLGQILWLNSNYNLSATSFVSVLVRLTAPSGSVGIILSYEDNQDYFRLQTSLESSCANESAAIVQRGAFTTSPQFRLTQQFGYGMRQNEWYQLRFQISGMAQTSYRMLVEWVDVNPLVGATPTSQFDALNPSLAPGGPIGLWCAARGSSGGCDFANLVVTPQQYAADIQGLECYSCNLRWSPGQPAWCRCCMGNCPPFDLASCTSQDGFCTTQCTMPGSYGYDYCATQTALAASGTSASPRGTTVLNATTTSPGAVSSTQSVTVFGTTPTTSIAGVRNTSVASVHASASTLDVCAFIVPVLAISFWT